MQAECKAISHNTHTHTHTRSDLVSGLFLQLVSLHHFTVTRRIKQLARGIRSNLRANLSENSKVGDYLCKTVIMMVINMYIVDVNKYCVCVLTDLKIIMRKTSLE